MYDLTLVDDNNNYVCPEFRDVLPALILDTDGLRDYARILKKRITNVSLDRISYKPLVFRTNITEDTMAKIDINNYNPVILITGVGLPDGIQYLCVDGKHRLNKLKENSVSTCKAYVFPYSDVQKFINRK